MRLDRRSELRLLEMTDEQREAADRLFEDGDKVFESKGGVPQSEHSDRDMPNAAFLFLATLVRLERASAYDIFRDIKGRDEGNRRLHLPMQSAYRAASWLVEAGYIKEDGVEESATNSLKKTFFAVTPKGAEALLAQAYRQFRIAVSWLPPRDR